ncbi:glycosyltransferase [Selenomonas ruminantium]|uniref:glycosyltransferase n=1 Tax=Selenomonas ruminantium TaxID=971 RepID=UPI000421CB67|nr:glycosyltransferase [Selenomonas ruminantium]
MKAVIAALRYSPAHIQLMIAYEKVLMQLGYQVSFLLVSQYIGCAEFKTYSRERILLDIEELEENKYDVLISVCAALDNIRLSKKANQKNISLFYIFHEPDVTWHRMKSELPIGTLKLIIAGVSSYITCKNSAGIIVASDYAYNQYFNSFRNANPNVKKIPLLFYDEISKEDIKHAVKKTFSYIGTACKAHAFSCFIDTIKSMYHNNLAVSCLIATKSDITDVLDDELRQMQENGVLEIHHGKVMSNAEINKYYLNSFCVWNAYAVSTQSGVLGKAFMAGTPVIANDTGAFREFVSSGVDGEFVDLKNKDDIIDKVMKIKNNLAGYSRNARIKYEKIFAYSSNVDKINNLLERRCNN